jgi:predicted site-specific integrase-resolvase
MKSIEEHFYTLSQVAELLGYKHDTLRKYYYLGKKLPKVTILPSGKKLIRKTDYKKYIDEL